MPERRKSTDLDPFISSLPCGAENRQNPARVKWHWEIIADKLSKAGWSWGCVATVDSSGRTIFVADAQRGNAERFVVRADEKLTAFMELQAATRAFSESHRQPGDFSTLSVAKRILNQSPF
jgi:hypothetical protein